MENKNNIKRTKLKPNKLEMANLMLPQCGQASIAPVLFFSSSFYGTIDVYLWQRE